MVTYHSWAGEGTTRKAFVRHEVPIGRISIGVSITGGNTSCGAESNRVERYTSDRKIVLTVPIQRIGSVQGNWVLSIPIWNIAVANATKSKTLQGAASTYKGIPLTAKKVNVGPAWQPFPWRYPNRFSQTVNRSTRYRTKLADSRRIS